MPGAVLLLLFGQLAPLAAASGGVVTGTVLDPSGAPIAGALVRASAASSALTDDNGMFVLPGVQLPATVEVTAPGFARASSWVRTADTGPVRFVLQPVGIAESITVAGNAGGMRIATPASATVLDADALAAVPSLALDDVLRSIPGFSLFRRSSSRVANPTTQGVTLRGLSASGASRTLVLADGLPLNDPFGGWVTWNRVPAVAIGRVQVARGGASDLHGGDALGGVITIETRTDAVWRMQAEAGQQDTGRLSVYGGQRPAGWDLFGAAELFTTGGYPIVGPEARGPVDVAAASRHGSAIAGGGVPIRGSGRLGLRAGYFGESRDNGTPLQDNSTVIRQASASIGGVVGAGTWTVRGQGSSQAYWQSFSAVAADRASERLTNAQRVAADSAGVWGDWLQAWGPGAVLVAASTRHNRIDLREQPFAVSGLPLAPAEIPARQHSAALSVQISMPFGNRGLLAGGARAESWRTSSREQARSLFFLAPSVSAAYRVSPFVSLRASVRTGFRAPTVNELYRGFRVGNVLTQPNAELAAEEVLGAEGALLLTSGRSSVRVVGFISRLGEPIVNATLSVTPELILRQRANAGRIRAAGLEVESDVRLTRALAFTGSLSATDSRFRDDPALGGLSVPQVPRVQAAAAVRATWSNLTMWLEWRGLGRQFDDDRNLFVLERSSRIDARAGLWVRPRVELFLSVENLLNEVQDVGRTPIRTTGMPRTARVGVAIR